MRRTPLIAVLDIGKTHTRLSLADPVTGETTWSAGRESKPISRDGLSQLDLASTEVFILEHLRRAPDKICVTALAPVTHGAAAVLLDAEERVLAAPDYEDPRFDLDREQYEARRDPFAETFSPALPCGLNLGAQFDYIRRRLPEVDAAADLALLYPQYWAWRLSGVAASEVTSLGVHTDLWRPLKGDFSALAKTSGWADWFPPLRRAGESLGPILPHIAGATGLNPVCQVLCGIHDSNASYSAHLAGQPKDAPFAVISSGTWTIVMARGVDLHRLRPEWDMLANVDADGQPAATARFMGGRDYERLSGGAGGPDEAGLASVIGAGLQAWPDSLASRRVYGSEGEAALSDLPDGERAALATLYCALMCDLLLDRLGFRGPVAVDGPLRRNPWFGCLLAALRPGQPVLAAEEAGAVAGVCALLGGRPASSVACAQAQLPGLQAYRDAWRRRMPI